MLPREAYIKHADGTDEVEFGAANINVSAILDKLQSKPFGVLMHKR